MHYHDSIIYHCVMVVAFFIPNQYRTAISIVMGRVNLWRYSSVISFNVPIIINVKSDSFCFSYRQCRVVDAVLYNDNAQKLLMIEKMNDHGSLRIM